MRISLRSKGHIFYSSVMTLPLCCCVGTGSYQVGVGRLHGLDGRPAGASEQARVWAYGSPQGTGGRHQGSWEHHHWAAAQEQRGGGGPQRTAGEPEEGRYNMEPERSHSHFFLNRHFVFILFTYFILLFNVIFKEGSPFQLKTAFQRSPSDIRITNKCTFLGVWLWRG